VISIEQTAKQAGYDLIFSNIVDLSQQHLHDTIHKLGRWQVDGILLFTPVVGNQYKEFVDVAGNTPIVQIDASLGANIPSVLIDQYHGSQDLTQHLIDLGHRNICEISGPLNWFGAAARHDGWRETMLAHGLDVSGSVKGDWTAASGYQAALSLLANRSFTALVVGNDQMALGAIRALHAQGIQVPEDVSITGFDDIPDCAYYEPPLTTVRQEFDMLGQLGVTYLIERIEHPDTSIEQRIIPTTFIQRLSTAPR